MTPPLCKSTSRRDIMYNQKTLTDIYLYTYKGLDLFFQKKYIEAIQYLLLAQKDLKKVYTATKNLSQLIDILIAICYLEIGNIKKFNAYFAQIDTFDADPKNTEKNANFAVILTFLSLILLKHRKIEHSAKILKFSKNLTKNATTEAVYLQTTIRIAIKLLSNDFEAAKNIYKAIQKETHDVAHLIKWTLFLIDTHEIQMPEFAMIVINDLLSRIAPMTRDYEIKKIYILIFEPVQHSIEIFYGHFFR